MDEKLCAEAGRALQAIGFSVKTGAIVGATLVGAPSSTKNAGRTREELEARND